MSVKGPVTRLPSAWYQYEKGVGVVMGVLVRRYLYRGVVKFLSKFRIITNDLCYNQS